MIFLSEFLVEVAEYAIRVQVFAVTPEKMNHNPIVNSCGIGDFLSCTETGALFLLGLKPNIGGGEGGESVLWWFLVFCFFF